MLHPSLNSRLSYIQLFPKLIDNRSNTNIIARFYIIPLERKMAPRDSGSFPLHMITVFCGLSAVACIDHLAFVARL